MHHASAALLAAHHHLADARVFKDLNEVLKYYKLFSGQRALIKAGKLRAVNAVTLFVPSDAAFKAYIKKKYAVADEEFWANPKYEGAIRRIVDFHTLPEAAYESFAMPARRVQTAIPGCDLIPRINARWLGLLAGMHACRFVMYPAHRSGRPPHHLPCCFSHSLNSANSANKAGYLAIPHTTWSPHSSGPSSAAATPTTSRASPRWTSSAAR